MPAKIKYGIEYFRTEVNHFRSVAMRRAIIKDGPDVIAVYFFMQAEILIIGHSYQFDDEELLVFFISDGCNCPEDRVTKALEILLKYGLFDKESYDNGYLTSVEIQKKYYKVTKRRKVRYLEEGWLLSNEEMDLIDKKNTVETVNNLHQDESNLTEQVQNGSQFVNESKQSKSHSQSQTERKEGLKIQDKGVLPPVIIPSHFDRSFKSFILQGALNINDPITEMLNEFFTELRDNYTNRQVRDATMHTLNQLHKNGWVDGDNEPIKDKYRYIKSAMINNLNIIINNENDAEDDRPFIEKLVDNLPGLKKNRTEITS
jgi:CRISPR/Cas system-associated exonuclease Cas4 (RecB family)